ncbi:regulator of chromosome condensation 1/beta-lactamase-inhibitor protein II [Naematelia encephala]|uniref:Regulator of chromosome condensation 1/beta-lactamase-inhibitor protein II n=1 Tax=Naematelia encephala TaxID=71784 RepID=A0A1Y2BF20_9TREE|nr:regulator of chromosome condensation 1/beta-lactamase-inhibitor protein II [Naematelia encephala]
MVDAEQETSQQEPWGRVLISGGVKWESNGRKDRGPASSGDLLEPHTLRSLVNIKCTKLITGPAANYAIVIDIFGSAHIFGKSPLGLFSELSPHRVTCASVGLPKGAKWIAGAAARSHCLLVDDQGGVWGAGNNAVGQLGLSPCATVDRFTRTNGPWTNDPDARVVLVSAGNTFSLFLTSTGQVFAAGSSESGQLGNGKTGQRLLQGGKIGFDLEVPAKLVQGLTGRKIVQIASGNQHSLAVDEEGYVYAWGFAGYSRLGLQDQKDRLVPTLVPQFAGSNAMTRGAEVLCGPTNSVVVDRQRLYWMAGKWKLTGDGSTGQPWTSFKNIQDIMSCKTLKASCGGCTHFITTPADAQGGVMTVGFGQGVLYGELGLGSGKDMGKSSTRPTEIVPLQGIDVIDVAAGAFFTLFLARPNNQLQDIPRWPKEVDSGDVCLVCKTHRNNDDLIECEKCEEGYHLDCVDPPLSAIPEGEWFCPVCEKEGNTPPDESGPIETPMKNGKRTKSETSSIKGSGNKRRR